MGQGKSKISENNEIFEYNPDILKKINSSKFKCILYKDYHNLTNKLGKKIHIEFDNNELNLIRKETQLISINYNDINDWKFDEDKFLWSLCFNKYLKSDVTSNSDSLELIELEDELNTESFNYQVIFKFESLKELKNVENSIYIYLGTYMIQNKMITQQEYTEWFSKYHKNNLSGF